MTFLRHVLDWFGNGANWSGSGGVPRLLLQSTIDEAHAGLAHEGRDVEVPRTVVDLARRPVLHDPSERPNRVVPAVQI